MQITQATDQSVEGLFAAVNSSLTANKSNKMFRKALFFNKWLVDSNRYFVIEKGIITCWRNL